MTSVLMSDVYGMMQISSQFRQRTLRSKGNFQNKQTMVENKFLNSLPRTGFWKIKSTIK